ncbi:AAA family ATPase [Methanolacinia petrolearia]|uniref:AAA family ATPase n=1 Tax=Methanolacinia petrolearia TaxID=54120 RepID=UPI003BAD61F9
MIKFIFKLSIRFGLLGSAIVRIKKVNIENYKCFNGKFSIEFNDGVNVLVGNNESGKSTILEAVNLALTGVVGEKYLKNNLSQYLFDFNVVNDYLSSLESGENPHLPIITIEVFFDDDNPVFEGNWNSDKEKGCGVVLKIEFDDDYLSEYENIGSVEILILVI